MVINREMGVRHRVTVVRVATGVLVDDVDEVAFPEVLQEPFRVAPAAGNGAAAFGVHVDRMALHRYRNVAAMEAKVGGKPRASRIWRGNLVGTSGYRRRIGDCGRARRSADRSVGRPGMNLLVPYFCSRCVIGCGRGHCHLMGDRLLRLEIDGEQQHQ